MAEINNPQLTSFCNERLRPFADRVAALDAEIPAILSTYIARSLETLITKTPADLIADGSDVDGRTRVIGDDVFKIIAFMNDFKAILDKLGARDIVFKWQVHGV